MRFIGFEEVQHRFRGKSVAIVGGAPSAVENAPGFVDSHDLVIRVNNYKLGPNQGQRADVHYSFYGTSIRKTAAELQHDGVSLCLCKCPNSRPIDSDWHIRNGRIVGIDFRYIYDARRAWWFCDTFVPEAAHFLKGFELLDKHIPTTGFSAILDVLACDPGSVYLTGFDFFRSQMHNVDETWRKGNPNDPIGHRPEFEAQWLKENASAHSLQFDEQLKRLLT